MKKIVSSLVAIMTMCTMISTPINSTIVSDSSNTITIVQTLDANAASVRKCFTINTSNTPVYSNTNLSANSKIGSIYPTDEIVVNDVTSKYTKVTYPISGGRTKTGYIATSTILTGTTGNTYTSKGTFPTYKRNTTDSKLKYGSVAKNDKCIVLGTKGGMVQIKYPVSGGFKYAFCTASDAKNYLGYGTSTNTYNLNTSTTKSSTSKTPTVYKQNGQNWSSYKYGWYYSNGKKVTGTVGSSGCGLLSLTNAVYYLNGKFIEPTVIAKYSLDNGYRVNNVGTSCGLYKSFCSNRGGSYGIKYVNTVSSYSDLRNYLNKGNVAIIHATGHIMACVSYSNGKYLVLDSYPSKNRGTSNGYAWKTEQEMNKLLASKEFHIIGKNKIISL